MGVDSAIDITDEQRKTILTLLQRYLPGTAAWTYGSRVKWTSRPQSDLDLVVFATPEQSGRVGVLREAFEESDLPFRVDLFVWDEVPESFRKQIGSEHVVLVEKGKRPIASEWCEIPFARLLAEHVRNGIYKKKEFHGRGVKIVNMGELFAHPRLRNVHMKRVELSEREKHHVSVLKGDLLFARRSLVAEGAGKCSVVLDIDEPTTFESSIIRARPNPAKADPLFLYYYFNSPHGLHGLDSIRRQVAVAGITGSDLVQLRVLAPPLHEQRAIAHALGSLDDKIELNRRMNESLEAMVRALFKAWFVDFDPVRAKVEGRDTGLPRDIADLFPDRMVDSELGKIPEGWHPGRLADIAHAPRRGVHPADVDFETPYIGLEHMPRHSIALMDWGSAGSVTSNKSVCRKGDILFGKLRPYFHKVGIVPLDGICSTDIVVIAPEAKEWTAFVLACVSSNDFVSYTNQTSTGTRMPRTNWENMGNYRICLPTTPVRRAFQNATRPMLDRIVANTHEFRTVTALRDTLLPKLISGELRVKDASERLGISR